MVTFLEMKKLMAIDKKCLIFFMKRTIFEWGAALQNAWDKPLKLEKNFTVQGSDDRWGSF